MILNVEPGRLLSYLPPDGNQVCWWMVVIIFYRSTKGRGGEGERGKGRNVSRRGKWRRTGSCLKIYGLPGWWRLMFYEWSKLRCTGIIADQRRKLGEVDDFVTSLRKETTVQSGRGNLYRGKLVDRFQIILDHPPRCTRLFCFCLNIINCEIPFLYSILIPCFSKDEDERKSKRKYFGRYRYFLWFL